MCDPLVPLRLLTVAHSYAVGLNRRLAHELARAGGERWEVTCVAPKFYWGDLRPIEFEPIANEPCRTLTVPAYGTRWPHLFFYGLELRELMRRDWQVIHAWEEPYVLAGYQLARWAAPRAKFVFWTAQNLGKRYPPPFSWFERRVMARADSWLYCGQSVREALSTRYAGLPSAPAPLGVDVDAFAPDASARRRVREQLGWSDSGAPVVGFLGRFVEEKGVRLLTRVLDRVATPFRVLFVGGGPLERELRTWGARYPDRVRVASATHAEVPAYLNAMDLLCAPSQTLPRWQEQFGRMLTEAMACGVAVLGSDSGEIPFVIGDAGRVLREDDVEAWTQALTELLENSDRRRELAERGLARAHEQFSWPTVARRQLAFFQELVESKR